jgi:hypothetical protein
MINTTIKPGDKVVVLDPYLNRVTKKFVRDVLIEGVRLEGDALITNFAHLFSSEDEANDALLRRAENAVVQAERDLKNAELRLKKLRLQKLRKSLAAALESKEHDHE